MNLREINQALELGKVDEPGVLPRLENLKEISHVFRQEFGLDKLTEEPGLLVIRGPRQYGKSTWLESQIRETISCYGQGTAFYLNGDEIKGPEELSYWIAELARLFPKEARVKRFFIDEITAIEGWEKVLKRFFDRGELKGILMVSTGSKATDLRRGSERLPGRKGKLDRTSYLFTPISFREFERVCGAQFAEKTPIAYLISGGCPIACNELAVNGKLPEYIIQMIRDWMYGECIATGRSRTSLMAVLEVLIKFGGVPVGQSKLAREAGLANNTVAQGYAEFLGDLLAAAPCYIWDASRKRALRRRPCKFHFTNVLAAVCWHSSKLRTLQDFERLDQGEKAKFYEWLAAQEIWRRAAIRGEEIPERLSFWKSPDHEIDFVLDEKHFLEVKVGPASALEFGWFSRVFPGAFLEVVNERSFETEALRGVSLGSFLRS